MLRKKDAESVRPLIKIYLTISTILIFAYFFLIYFGVRYDNEVLLWIGFIFLGISTFIAIILAIKNFTTRPEDDYNFEK